MINTTIDAATINTIINCRAIADLRSEEPNIFGPWYEFTTKMFNIDAKLTPRCFKPSLYITNVIYNDPATIVFWSDKTKTVVKCSDQEVYDPEKGLTMCIAKKMLGNKGNYYNEIRKWLKNA